MFGHGYPRFGHCCKVQRYTRAMHYLYWLVQLHTVVRLEVLHGVDQQHGHSHRTDPSRHGGDE